MHRFGTIVKNRVNFWLLRNLLQIKANNSCEPLTELDNELAVVLVIDAKRLNV